MQRYCFFYIYPNFTRIFLFKRVFFFLGTSYNRKRESPANSLKLIRQEPMQATNAGDIIYIIIVRALSCELVHLL